jgi:N6-L-threonylcarbamoyladenine synthase
MKILGIETSCDETAVAIVDDQKNILSHILHSQIELHKKYGGVVPEIAARSHIEVLDGLILDALKQANLKFTDLDGIAATAGPGLIGGVIVGLTAAKTLASILQKPFIAINHLEAHALTARLTNDVEFPYLLLLLSGGHCHILLAESLGNYRKIGETIDDALGEAFDKVSQMLGMPYPGGPAIEKLAVIGDELRFNFPKPLIANDPQKKHLYNFSFSGLKTAVRRQIEKLTDAEFSHHNSHQLLSSQDKADICASFQFTVTEIILDRLNNVINKSNRDFKKVVIAGGVAANRYIFNKIAIWGEKQNLATIAPPLWLCTDNGAMIAWAGVEKLKLGLVNNLDFKPRAKWEL